MFTPQKKLWSLTRRGEPGSNNGSGPGAGSDVVSPSNGGSLAKGKGVAFLEGDGVMDQGTLTERVSKLENELFEYQYNMGLLLIEKKEWNLKYEELRQALAEATDALQREQTAHSSAMSEVEKREENLKKALGVERQCVLDLEKSLREMRSEHAEIKFNADSKLAEANALVASVEGKSLEVEAKFHAVDAKLAEVSRKSSEIERKLHDLEAQENALRRERSFFTAERDAHDYSISKQREDLRQWEQKLQEAEERLTDARRLLNQREERANENDKILKEKQDELEALRGNIDMANSSLTSKEEDISSRLASVALKEKEADDVRKSLEEKERLLLELEEKLNTREKEEIQKLLDEHNAAMAEKERDLELEMEQKRALQDEQLKNKVVDVEKREAEVAHMEEKVKKREQAVEKKMEKVREKETDYDSKSKDLKVREKTLKAEEKSLEKERKQMLAEKEDLLSMKSELENLKTETENTQLRLSEEREKLKVTEDERRELERLQLELKQEIDKYRFQTEQLMKEADDLKQEKERFEKEWEELDDKRAEILKEQGSVLEQKRYLDKLRQSEEEMLQNEKLETQQYIQREMEALKLAQESLAANMEHEKSLLEEKTQNEKSKLLHDFELRKQELETEMRKQQEEIESQLHEKEKSFEQEREMELNNISYLKEVARREMEEMKLERLRIEKEQLEISRNKTHVETQQNEMKKDIEELVSLSQKLKDQREQFIKERERFIAFVEKQKSCSICGETIREFMLSDLHPVAQLETLEPPPLPKVAENYLKETAQGTSERLNNDGSSPILFNSGSPTAGGTISWLRQCTSKIFKFSPGKKLDLDAAQDPKQDVVETPNPLPGGEEVPESSVQVANDSFAAQDPKQDVVETPNPLPAGEEVPESSVQVANDSFDVQIVESESGIKEVEYVQAVSVDQESLKTPRRAPGKKGRTRKSRPQSLKAVGISPDENENRQTNGTTEDSAYTIEETRAESDLAGTPRSTRKRNRAHGSQATVSQTQTEGQSDSTKDVDRPRRRRRVVPAEQNMGQKRYNLRNPKKSVGTVANGSLPQARKGKGKETEQLPGLEANPSQNVESGRVSRDEIDADGAAATLPGAADGDEPVRSSNVASEFSADSPFKDGVNTRVEHVDPGNYSMDDMVLSEVNGARDYSGEEFKSESRDDEDDNNDGDDDEVGHPGQVSIGKKLWTFLTT